MFTSTLQIQQWLPSLWRKELKCWKMYEDTSCCLNSPHMETPTHPKNWKETVQLHIFLLTKPFHPLISTLSSRDVKLLSHCRVTHMFLYQQNFSFSVNRNLITDLINQKSSFKKKKTCIQYMKNMKTQLNLCPPLYFPIRLYWRLRRADSGPLALCLRPLL